MKKLFTLLSIFFFLSYGAFAQKTGVIRGVIYDTAKKQGVAGATITLMQKKDSSLVTFTVADNSGRFELRNLANGEYRLMITHVNYHNKNSFFTISDETKTIEAGDVVVNDKSKMLGEVVVTAEAPPVTLEGDTVQYNAGSFKTVPNATVEQLLKKLPGVQVDKDGNIKAQGEKVNKVLVDGKEFFGTDPKIATRNLPADAIDKVQVYDRQSDQAQLTGFDDGNYEKTINLKLKKDKKKGVFGKATAGGGSDGRYESRFNVNSFKGARQLSVIGMGNNTNAEGFSLFDMLNFTGELNRLRQGGGGGNVNIQISDNNSGGLSGFNNGGTGIKTTWAGGVNYNNIIGNKTDFMSNYFYNRSNPRVESDIRRQYFLPDSSYFYNQSGWSNNVNENHRLNLTADIKLDSFHSLKIAPYFSYQDTRNRSYSEYSTFTEDNQLSSNGYSRNNSNINGYTFRNDLLFRKKFHTRGRTLSLSLQTSLNKSKGDGSQESVNEFYTKTSTTLRTDSILQQNVNNNRLWGYNARLVYTEPIFRKSLLELSLGKSNTESNSDKTTYDYNKASGKFDQLNNKLTNDFENEYGYITGGVRIRTQGKKITLAAGVNWQQADLEGKITSGIKDSVITKRFENLLPTARIQYNFNRFKNISINYNASTNQPTMTQLQPVPDISNPLNIKEGNPDLKQEYTHMLQLNFHSVNPFKNRNFFAFFNVRQTQNKIVNYDMVDTLGIKTSRPVNVNGVYNVSGNINVGLPLRFIKGMASFGSNITFNKGKQFINTKANDITDWQIGPDARLDINPTEKIDFALTAFVSYNNTKYSLNSSLNTKYFSQNYGAEFNWQLPKLFMLSTEFDYTINNQRAAGYNAKVPLWHASLSKQFLRYNRGELKFRVNDILNQNVGISRTSNQNYIEDSRVTVLKRFFMLSFTYSLTKNGLGAGGGNNMRIITR